jgi:hypothetical protein
LKKDKKKKISKDFAEILLLFDLYAYSRGDGGTSRNSTITK